MAASGTRHVGRVIDPLARDDGETEPELVLEAGESPGEAPPEPAADAPIEPQIAEIEAQSEPTGADPSAALPPSDDAPLLELEATEGVHPVKARLLARAAARRAARVPGAEPGGARGALDELGRGRGAEEQWDLDFEALPGAPPAAPNPAAPMPPRDRAPLSPTMVALFGTLLGLATVASIVALVMRIQPGSPSAASTPAASATAPSEAAAPPAQPEKRQRAKQPGPWRIADAKSEAGSRIVEGKIGSNAFLKALEDAGVEKKEAYRVFNALKDLKNLDKCERGDTFAALVERSSSRVKAFEYVVSKEEVYQSREAQNGELATKKLDFKVERAEVKGAFVVDGSDIDAAAEKGGLERGMAQALTRALDGHMSLDELKRGDVVRVVAQEVTVLGEFSRYAGIEAIEIRRADDKEKPFRLYYFRGQAEKGYFDDKGRSPYEGGWRKPIHDAPITSHFNPKRMHPILHKIMPHTGTDFGAPAGTPVGAASYGTISHIGPAGPSGNLVKIDHPGGVETGYAHLSRFAEGLKMGDKVKRLQLIGYVGSTGRSTGPHLHFTAKRNGEFFDAETLNLDGMRVISKDERDAFGKVRQQYDEALDSIPLPTPLPSSSAPVAAARPSAEPVEETGTGGPEPETPAAPSAAPAKGGNAPGGNPVYITDKELMKGQSASDEGEVSE